jgi:aminopeptidase YwaD
MIRRLGAPFFAAVLLATTAPAQPVKARVDGGAMHGYVSTLSSPDMLGRRTLTPGFDRAAAWAEARFREWGLSPAGDNGTFVQPVPVVGPKSDFAWATGMPALVVGGLAFSFKEAEFVVDPSSTAATDVSAEAVFAGYGISAPAKGLDEYAGLDVTGKVVFVLRGSPKDAPPDLTDFPPDPMPPVPPDTWADESSDQSKIMTAYGRGAAAIVLCDANPEARQAQPWPKAKPRPSPFQRPFLVVAADDARALRAVMLRSPQESLVGFVDRMNRLRRAIQQKKPQSESTGVRVRVKGFDEVRLYGESFGDNQSRNVLAKIEGADPVLRRQAVVIGAHLDHLGFRSGLIHPGADDNASGSAVVLEAARVLAASRVRPRRTIVFALWCGEENGHHGSLRFTAAPAGGLTMEQVVAYVNLDMVGLGTGVDAMGARDFPGLFAVMMRDQLPEVVRAIRPDVSGPGGSDYASFLAHGVEAVALFSSGGQGHPDYHDAADVADKVQPELLGIAGQFVMQAAFSVANETATPLPTPGRREVCESLRFVVPDIAGQSAGGWRTLAPRTPSEMQAAVVESIRTLRNSTEVVSAAGSAEATRLFVGARAAAFGGNLALLAAASAALDVARLDVEGRDDVWVSGGLTEAGRMAVAEAEVQGITINLVRPPGPLLADVLAVATRPVLVSGMTAADGDMARGLAAKNGAFAVECAENDVTSCAGGLHALRTALGGSGSLLVSMRAATATARQAHRALYLELAKKGWTKDEIFAVAGLTPDGDPGGNLARFAAK